MVKRTYTFDTCDGTEQVTLCSVDAISHANAVSECERYLSVKLIESRTPETVPTVWSFLKD